MCNFRVQGADFAAKKKNDSNKSAARSLLSVFLFFVFAFLPPDCARFPAQWRKNNKKAPVDALRQSGLPVVWVLGGPGSGKGTQCDLIVAKYGFTHLSTGDLLRAEVAGGSERGRTLTAIMERGELVPNAIVLDLLKEAMLAKLPTSKGFLIDGYPREQQQGVEFERDVMPCTLVLYFSASEDTLTKRLLGRAESSGRADDNADTIRLRLQTFLANNDKVLALYPEKLKSIDAETSVEEIFAQVQGALDPIAS